MKSQDSQDLTSILTELPFEAPEGYWYEVEEAKRNIAAVWLCNDRFWLFKNEKGHRTIHSFYHLKKHVWMAPINAKKEGKVVEPKDMTPYTAMPINRNPLMAAFFADK